MCLLIILTIIVTLYSITLQITEEIQPNAKELYIRAVSRFWYSDLQNIKSICQHLMKLDLTAVESWSNAAVSSCIKLDVHLTPFIKGFALAKAG